MLHRLVNHFPIGTVFRRDDLPDTFSWVSPGPFETPGIIGTSVSIVLATIFLAIRAWSQYKRQRLLALDNIVLLIAAVLAYAMMIMNILMLLTGYGDLDFSSPITPYIMMLYYKVRDYTGLARRIYN